MVKNKHIITALIVTPILAVIAYFAVDFFLSERPQQAESGGQYQLVQLPNCRYASGQCGLKNGNFKLIVTGIADSGSLLLKVKSVFSLDEAYVSVVREPAETVGPTKAMLPVTADGKEWRVNLMVIDPDQQYLRLAVTVEDAVYYAETAMPFLNYETSFKKDFRSNN